MRWKSHVRFGGRAGETPTVVRRQGAPVRPLHLRANPHRVRLPGHRPRRVQPPGRGLGARPAPAHGAGNRGAGDGRGATAADRRCPSFGPGLSVHVAGLRRPLPRVGRGAVDGLGGRLLRQRDGRELLRGARECELLNRTRLSTHAAARAAVFEFIEGWYNTRRRHSALGYRSPLEFERLHTAPVDGARPVDALRAPTSPLDPALRTGSTPPTGNDVDVQAMM